MWQKQGATAAVWIAACYISVSLFVALPAFSQTSEPLVPVPPPPSGPQVPAAPGQPTYPGQSVVLRPRPEVNPIGVHTGDYFWFPRAEIDESFNSNIFALPSATADLITSLQPSLDLLSSFPGNALDLHGGAMFQDYALHPTQNTATGFGLIDGRLDIDAERSLYGSVEAAHLYQPRTSPNSPGNAAEPVTYNNYITSISYRKSGLRLGYQADLGLQAAFYNAVPAFGGGILPQTSQDTVIPQAALQVSYELIPDYTGFIRNSAALYDYPRPASGGVRFNSTVYRVDLGLRVVPRHIIYGDVYIGYLRQVFATSGFGSVAAPDFGGRLVWDITRLTTLGFRAVRTFETSNPSIGITGAGYLASIASANVDHELLRDLLVNAEASFENDSYQSVSRTDDVYTIGLGIKYLMRRNLYVGSFFNYQQRTSTSSATGQPYSQSIVTVRISTQF
jgi:hypothetical protein